MAKKDSSSLALETPGRRLIDAGAVLAHLSEFCTHHPAGTVVPTHTEWMAKLGASERAVRTALDELQRQGLIVRRRGASTYIADNGPRTASRPLVPQYVADAKSIVAIATPDSSYFDQAMKELFRQAERMDLNVVCRMVEGKTTGWSLPDAHAVGQLGFILFRRDLTPLAQQLQAAGHRVVLVGAPAVDALPGVPNIYGDHEQGGYLATRHLLDLGHERIAFCGASDATKTLRWRGHQSAIGEARKRGRHIVDTQLPLDTIASWGAHPEKGHKYFQGGLHPTALAVWNDHEAVMALGVLQKLGIRVPDQVSVVGFDNLREGQVVHPALTTVVHSLEQQIHAALSALTRATPPPPHFQMVVVPNLIVRESTASPGTGTTPQSRSVLVSDG